ncbi:MAG: extensin family protein [Rhodobacteraceae bacterium]|nr:extensin family protein [Paracoccaceae bacterium]
MKLWAHLLAALALMTAAPAISGPEASPRPTARPTLEITEIKADLIAFEVLPAGDTTRPVARPTVVAVVTTRAATVSYLRPVPRPEIGAVPAVKAAAVRSQPSGVVSSSAGAICGADDIIGVQLSPIPGKLSGCGVENPVRVLAVAGVRLSRPSTMDCTTAKTLRSWVEDGAKPAVGRLGGGLEELGVAAHYACRTRNHQPGGKISEHGKGRAIDISSISLANGFTITVQNGWNDDVQGQVLRKMHLSACREFKTVLGPDSDRFHLDHFHFDTARRGGRNICR